MIPCAYRQARIDDRPMPDSNGGCQTRSPRIAHDETLLVEIA